MILVGIGSNLSSPFGPPVATCVAALRSLATRGVAIGAVSPWYKSAPVPLSDQPWFANGVAVVTTTLGASELLGILQAVEDEFGRKRSVKDAARTLDLDLLAFNNLILSDGPLLLPHPRLHDRAFVLRPLRDVAPGWRHPVSGLTAGEMADRLPPGQELRRFQGNP